VLGLPTRAISIKEDCSPALGGCMLAVSRTVAREKLRALEYLRIIECDGGLDYVARPGGAAATEFVLTELGASRAVFDNPCHDLPQAHRVRSAGRRRTARHGVLSKGRRAAAVRVSGRGEVGLGGEGDDCLRAGCTCGSLASARCEFVARRRGLASDRVRAATRSEDLRDFSHAATE
jgi:hypothetical protein